MSLGCPQIGLEDLSGAVGLVAALKSINPEALWTASLKLCRRFRMPCQGRRVSQNLGPFFEDAHFADYLFWEVQPGRREFGGN